MPVTGLRILSSTGSTKAAAKRLGLRDSLWPDAEALTWHRKKETGYSTIPRTIPLVMTLIDHLKKGKDLARVYLELWCRQMDDSFVIVDDEEELAFACGYTTPGRNVRSWRERIELLQDLGFIRVSGKGSRRHGFILLLHPHMVIKKLATENRVPPNWWGAFAKRAKEIGADLT